MDWIGKLNGFDWLLVAVLAWSTLSAFTRGLVRVLFSLAGWSVGVLAASWYYARLAPYLLAIAKTRPLSQAIAYVLILTAVVVAASMLGSMTHTAVKAAGLGFFNRLGGAAVGAARGCLVGVSLLMLLTAFLPKSEWVNRSKLTPYFLAGAHAVSFFVPAELQMQLAHGTTRLTQAVPGLTRNR